MAYGHSVEQSPRPQIHPSQQRSVHQTQGAHPSQLCPPSAGVQGPVQQQRSFSSSEEERSTPECASDEPDDSEKGESTFDFNESVPEFRGVDLFQTRSEAAFCAIKS